MDYMPKKERASKQPSFSSLRDRFMAAKPKVQQTEPPTNHDNAGDMMVDQQGTTSALGKEDLPKGKKRYLLFGTVLLVASIYGLMFLHTSASVTTGEAAESAISSGTSATLPAGARLATNDKDTSFEPTDYTIEGKTNDPTTKLYVWDYAGEDGDYVQLIINGEPASEEFMILNKPREFDIPTSGEVQVKGIHDAGGGLTYAVHCNLNGQSYFNNAPEGVLNTYTIVGG